MPTLRAQLGAARVGSCIYAIGGDTLVNGLTDANESFCS